ncbi:MAG: hypothetical protein Q8M29_06420 [Bacteroidota bacterium]|nr:hypothetical protein [Bacteroidota bacterium]
MKKLIALLLTFYTFQTFAQKGDYKKYYEEGTQHLDDGNHLAALQSFQKAYKIDSTNGNINFQIGYCYLKHPSYKHLAEEYLERAIKQASKKYDPNNFMEKNAPLQAYLWLGEAYHLDYKFDEAEKLLKLYEEKADVSHKDKEEYAEVERLRRINKTAKAQYAKPAKIKTENLGDSINSEFPDFSPVLSADERVLIFTYRGKRGTGGEMNVTPDGQYFEDIFVSYKKYDGSWTEAKSIGPFVNTMSHEASVSVTPDGQTLILYKDDNGDGNLYYSSWSGSEWGTPTKFGDEINTKYWETHACFNVTKDILYFVSDRPGGFGGRDIYRSKKLPNGKWGKPTNLGPTINTAYDEDAPYLHANGNDFYFASQDHGTMGGFDIFKSNIILGTDSFTKPVAMPYPINTPDDDVFFVVSADNRRAYYASSHEDKTGHGEKDIYKIFMPDPEEPPLVLFLGQILPALCDIIPPGLEVQVTDVESNDLVGIYRPQPNTGSYTLILFPGKKYNFSYMLDGKEIHNDKIETSDSQVYQEIKREVQLKPIILDPTSNQQVPCVVAKLDVKVYDNKTNKQLVPNAAVVLIDRIGRKVKAYANEKGIVDPITIRIDDEFSLTASSGEKTCTVVKFNTAGIPENATIVKELYMDGTDIVAVNEPDAGLKSLPTYKFYFKYNKNEIDVNDAEFKAFISKVGQYGADKKKLDITIASSASEVPTKTFGNNKKLAASRAKVSKEKVMSALKTANFDTKKIRTKEKAEVNGPQYNGDYLEKMAEYEKYQYVEISVK